MVIFIGDGWANIDMGGNGPGYYRFEEMQAISIGAYLPPGQVAWLGNFNGPLGTYDGQVLADAMEQVLRLKEDIPNFLMFTLGVHSNATFRPDLLGFMALYTGADFFDVTSAADLVARAGRHLRRPRLRRRDRRPGVGRRRWRRRAGSRRKRPRRTSPSSWSTATAT